MIVIWMKTNKFSHTLYMANLANHKDTETFEIKGWKKILPFIWLLFWLFFCLFCIFSGDCWASWICELIDAYVYICIYNTLFSSAGDPSHTCVTTFHSVSWILVILVCLFVCFSLSTFYWSVFRFTSSFLSSVQVLFKPI